MDTWKLLLITLLSAVVLGCIIGILTGKHLLKKARGNYKPLLNVKERIVYSLCILVGAACILVGIFVAPGWSMGGGEPMVDEFGNPGIQGDVSGGMLDGELGTADDAATGDAATDDAVVAEDNVTADNNVTVQPRSGTIINGGTAGSIAIIG